MPTSQPTTRPTGPTFKPTLRPTAYPTSQPTGQPTAKPTSQPTSPTGQPTSQPSYDESLRPKIISKYNVTKFHYFCHPVHLGSVPNRECLCQLNRMHNTDCSFCLRVQSSSESSWV